MDRKLPPVWLIVLIAGLPLFSETAYSPSLPDIAHALHTSDAMAEYTMTIYLAAFAIGIMCWGMLSDRVGRKPALLYAFSIYTAGCIGCYFSATIEALMMSRVLQAFGASAGSVLGQTISRDAFHGKELNKVYSTVGAALGAFPAVGPVVGGFIAEFYGWSYTFLFLIIAALIMLILIAFRLPETIHPSTNKTIPVFEVLLRMSRDRKVLFLALIIGCCNGISFSYYAEAPFLLTELLGLSQSSYGSTFIFLAVAFILGGLASKRLLDYISPVKVLHYGILIMLGSAIFAVFSVLNIGLLSNGGMIFSIVISQMMMAFGNGLAASNVLAIALTDYKSCLGTAASLFGGFYYCIVSCITLLMGSMHDGTLWPMPLYFLFLTMIMLAAKKLSRI